MKRNEGRRGEKAYQNSIISISIIITIKRISIICDMAEMTTEMTSMANSYVAGGKAREKACGCM